MTEDFRVVLECRMGSEGLIGTLSLMFIEVPAS